MEDDYYIKQCLEEIKNRLANVESSINRIESLERAELEYMDSIQTMESRELEGIDKLHAMESSQNSKIDGLKPLKYHDLMMWKNSIWENCPMKIMIDSRKMVLFNCKTTGKVCSFGNCPRNITGND